MLTQKNTEQNKLAVQSVLFHNRKIPKSEKYGFYSKILEFRIFLRSQCIKIEVWDSNLVTFPNLGFLFLSI